MDKLDKIKELIKPYYNECLRVGCDCRICNVIDKCNEMTAPNTRYTMTAVYFALEHLEKKI